MSAVLDLRPVILVTGILLTTLGAAMLIPALVDAVAGNPDWQVFAGSSAASLARRSAMSLCLKIRLAPPLRRMPSIIEAWFSSSE